MATSIQQTMTAIREGTVSEVRLLLAKFPDLLTEHGSDMIEHAAESNRVEMLPILVAAGIDVNAAVLSHTPLGSAVRHGAFEAAQWLLDHGADVSGRADPKGPTPLHEAIVKGRLDMVKFLLERGADPNALYGNPGRNAVAAAKFSRRGEITAFLESQGLSETVVEARAVNVEHPSFMSSDNLGPSEWFDKKWRHVYDHGTRKGLDALGEKNQVLFLVGYLIDQLCNGGALMLYYNPSGGFTVQMAKALDKIGANRAAQLIGEISALFPGGVPAADREARERQIEKLPTKASDLGAELERLFDDRVPNGGERVLRTQLHDYYNA
jgi:Domain of unknown function (DUF4375)/Ankyrin repeats (3 copies)